MRAEKGLVLVFSFRRAINNGPTTVHMTSEGVSIFQHDYVVLNIWLPALLCDVRDHFFHRYRYWYLITVDF